MTRLHLVRVPLRAERLFRLTPTLRLPPRALDDTGYLIHAQFRALFGDLAPKPFSFPAVPKGRVLPVLGYASADADALRKHAMQFADPRSYEGCVVDELAAKPMPEHWEKGQRLGFDVRACPIVRKGRGATKEGDRGPELDVYLDALLRSPKGSPPDRETVYTDWLRRELARAGAALLLDARIHRLQRERLVRRQHDRDNKSRMFDRPDVTFGGTLVVDDAEAFAALLARGVGRHRAFGFGMLLLRPAR